MESMQQLEDIQNLEKIVFRELLQLYYGGKTKFEKVFWDDYYLKIDVPDIDKLKLQEEEVESVHWFSVDEIKNLMKEGKFFKNHYEEFEILLDWLKNNSKYIKNIIS